MGKSKMRRRRPDATLPPVDSDRSPITADERLAGSFIYLDPEAPCNHSGVYSADALLTWAIENAPHHVDSDDEAIYARRDRDAERRARRLHGAA